MIISSVVQGNSFLVIFGVRASAPAPITCLETHVVTPLHGLSHLWQVLPAPPGSDASKRLTVSKSETNFEEEPEAAVVQPRPVTVSGKAGFRGRCRAFSMVF